MEQAQALTSEELLKHLKWAQALARRLVADESAAEDVVQDSMVAALESPPKFLGAGDGGGLRPWLGAVMRNVARQRGRADGRRAYRERKAAKPEALPSAVDLTGRTEAQRLLLSALLTLDEESRRLVLLRYNEGLSAAEIARQLDQPAGSVRSRIKRALDRLRVELDQRHGGDRSAWHAAVAPLALSKVAGRSAVAVSGGAGWVLGTLMGVGAVAALGLVAVLQFSDHAADVAVSSEPLGLSASDETIGLAPIEEPGERAEIVPVLAEAETDAATAAIVHEGPAKAPPRFGVFQARFVDEDRSPVSGVVVETRGSAPVVSGAGGRVEFNVEYHEGWGRADFQVNAPGFATDSFQRSVEPDATTDLGEIVLIPGGDIEGRVVDDVGTPKEGLTVSTDGRMRRVSGEGGLQAYASTGQGRTETKTDAEGRFRLRGVCAGRVNVEVTSEDELWSAEARAVKVTAGAVVEDLVITAESRNPRTIIEGVLLDHLGAPVPYGQITTSWSRWLTNHRGSTTCDEAGHFLAIVGEGAKVEMHFFGTGSALAGASRAAVRGGTRDLEIRLQAPRTREVKVVDDAGEPVSGARVGIRKEGGGASGLVTRADGTAELPVTTMDMELDVQVEGYDRVEVNCEGTDPAEWDAAPPVLITLTGIAQLRGTVRADGAPVEGAELSVRRMARFKETVLGLPSLVQRQTSGKGVSDHRGEFRLTIRESGEFMLRAEAPGHAPAEYGPFRYEVNKGLGDVMLDLTAGGSVEGRVRDGQGIRQRHVVMLARGDGVGRTVRTDLDGRYRFEHVTPGPCFLRVVPEMLGPGEGSSSSMLGLPYRSIVGDCVVLEGQVTRHDLLTGEARVQVSVRGRLVLEGVDPTRFQARLVPSSGGTGVDGRGSTAEVAPDGSFSVEGAESGVYILTLRDAGDGLDGEVLTIGGLLDLPPGETEWTFQAKLGSVRTGAHADPNLHGLWRLDPSGTFVMAPMANVSESQPFPAGEVRRVTRRSLLALQTMGDLETIESIEEGNLAAGGTLVLGQ